MSEIVEEIRRVNEQLVRLQKMYEDSKSTRAEYSVVTVFVGFIPVFLFLMSYFQNNPAQAIGYWVTGILFIFFLVASFIWAIIQIGEAKTPFTYSMTLILPIFIVALPLLMSTLVTLEVLPTSHEVKTLAFVIIAIYAITFFAYFAIELLYRRLFDQT